MIDVAVIGGGAAGLSAAINAALSGKKVSIIEGNDAPGKKILISGGGRCNFTNFNLSYRDYYDCNKEFVSSVLNNFSPIDAVNFMFEQGIFPVIRNGYAYPASEEGSTLRDALVSRCESLGIAIHNNSEVNNITRDSEGFNILTEGYTYKAANIILTCGGAASPSTGSKGDGYSFAKNFGHNVTKLTPGLTGICFKSALNKAAGTRFNGAITLKVDNNIFKEQGEIQINDYGISGVPVLSLSRIVGKNIGKIISLSIDFLPALTDEEASELINTCKTIGILPRKLAAALSGRESDLKNFVVIPTGVKGFETAHVTCGGIDTSEVNEKTMESKLCPGLFFAGEILDVDGRCGGFNLHFAWASGAIAGQSAAMGSYTKKEVSEERKALFSKCEIGNRRS